jgi:hypothetical protein
MAKSNLEQLENFLNVMNRKAVTHEDFVRSFKNVALTIKKVEKKLEEQLKSHQESLADLSEKLAKEMTSESKEEIQKMQEEAQRKFDEEMRKNNEALALIKEKAESLRDGRDADEEAMIMRLTAMIAEMMPEIPEIPEFKQDTAEETRDKLEMLKGDERLDKNAIRGLDEALRKASRKGGGGGGTRGFNLKVDGTKKGYVNDVDFKSGTGITLTTSTATGAPAITVNATGGGSGDVTAAANFANDNRLIRSDGTLKGVQPSGITINDSDAVSGATIDGDNNTISNLDIGNEVDWAAATDVSDASAFASGDKLLIFEAGVGLRKIDHDDLPSGSGLSNIVEDTTPQLGGTLDANGNVIQLANGSVSSPSLQFGSDTNTGIYRSLGDEMRFTTGGSQRLALDNTDLTLGSGVDIDMAASTDLKVNGTAILSDSAGTMTLSNVDAIDATTEATIEAAIDTLSNLTTVGALNSGSITSGFGAIDNGSSNITTTGDISGGTVNATGDTSAGDNSALGYTATEGAILTGQGSTNDVTIKNDADAAVIQIPTGTVHVNMAASSQLQVDGTAILSDSAGTMTLSNVDAIDATTEATLESAIDSLTNLTATGTITSGTWNSSFGATANEAIEDLVGGMVTGNTETGITVTYQDGDGTLDFAVDTASDTTSGIVELATTAETDTGTDTGRAVTPDGLAGSYAGTKNVQVIAFDFATDVATGDGKFYFRTPEALDGMNLVAVHAEVITAGTTGTTDIQIHNVDNALDMLSTKLTIDSGETGSDTAATAAVINTSNDHVNTNDILRLDVDAVSTTAPQGLIVSMDFRLP